MRRLQVQLTCILLAVTLLNLQGCFHQTSGRSNKSIPLDAARQRFIVERTQTSWSQLLDLVATAPNDRVSVQVQGLHQYALAKLHRDLPNSMALKNDDPNSSAERSSRDADAALEKLKGANDAKLARLLESAIEQNFDESLFEGSAEVYLRIWPQQRDVIEHLAVGNPSKQSAVVRIGQQVGLR